MLGRWNPIVYFCLCNDLLGMIDVFCFLLRCVVNNHRVHVLHLVIFLAFQMFTDLLLFVVSFFSVVEIFVTVLILCDSLSDDLI